MYQIYYAYRTNPISIAVAGIEKEEEEEESLDFSDLLRFDEFWIKYRGGAFAPS